MRVLVVDDDQAILRSFELFFKKRGDDYVLASDGNEALRVLEDRVFDVVLSDIRMPEMDGLELVRRAKALQPHLACVLISGLGSRGDIITALKVGVFDFVDKPIRDLAEFTMVMERAAESSRLTQERDALLENLKEQNARLEFSVLRLHEAFGQLRQQEEALESDLVRAQHVQQTLLPRGFPAVKELDLFGYFAPCEHLGGDFFGVIRLNDGRFAVYLVDVAGHGVGAAMVTVTLRELMRTPQRNGVSSDLYRSPARVLGFINEAMLAEQFEPPIFVSMVYAVFDPSAGSVTVGAAGHPPPLWIGADGHPRPVPIQGSVLGMRTREPFTDTTLELQPGDTVLFYSDGVTEARNAAQEEFSVERLRETIRRNRTKRAAALGAALEHALAEHLGSTPAADDVTFIVACRPDVPNANSGAAAGDGIAAGSVRSVRPGRLRFFPREDRGQIKGGWHGRTCIIRLSGLATWQLASTFREMMTRATRAPLEDLQIDLADCEALDSTMLGSLLQHAERIALHQPGTRVIEQLREMGVLDRFRISHEPCPPFQAPIAIEPSTTHEPCSELILSAHEALMEASASNRHQFEEVVAALRTEVERSAAH